MITHAVIFSPIEQSSRSDQIVQRLSNAIVSGLLEANEQLPNEAELARMMGVSHITIREALNTLRANGLIYTVRGRNGGSFIASSIDKQASFQHPFNLISTEYLSDLGEWHGAIFCHAAKLATTRMTGNDIATLTQFVNTLEQASTAEMRCQADMRCLLTIAANSQSARIASQELIIQSEWASLVTLLYRSDTIHRSTVDIYRKLLTAFLGHDELAVMELASTLIDELKSNLIEYKISFKEIM